MIRRLRGLFTTMAGRATWARLLGLLLAMLGASWLLDLLGLAPWQPDFAFLLGFGSIAGLGTALVEEAMFRGIMLSPPPEGAPGYGRAALSAIIFALWHPFQTFFYHPLWEPYAWRWWFLGGTALFGFLCARFTLSSRSIWPAVVLHLVAALAWKTLYGIPSCGLAPCVLYR